MSIVTSLNLPKDRFSPIDFIIEEMPDFKEAVSILLSSNAYERMQQAPFLKYDNYNVWIGEECYPAISYELTQITFDLWAILWIEYDGARYYFTTNYVPLGKSIYITY